MVPVEVLKQFPIFEGLSDSVLGKIAQVSYIANFPANKLLFSEGDKSDELYLLSKGRLAVERQLPLAWPNPIVSIHTVVAKQMFGWSAVVQPGLRTASARCLEDSEAVVIKGKDLLDILEDNRQDGYLVMKRFANTIATSLASTNEKLMREMAMLESYTTQAPRPTQ